MTPRTRSILAVAAAAAFASPAAAQFGFDLTILHSNDNESALLPTTINGVEVGGAARFASLVDQQRVAAANAGAQSLLIGAGDMILPGPVLNVADASGNFYDAEVINSVGYNALAIGNHEFDLGPSFFADYVGEIDASIPYLSANLDFSAEPQLQALVDNGRIRANTIVTLGNGAEVGLIGLTTPDLPTISNAGNVSVRSDIANVVNEQVALLEGQGIDNIVLVSHLQSLNNELNLVGQIRGVDAIIGGGGDELLINTNPVAPGDESLTPSPYPLTATDLDGNVVPVVSTTGQYNYLGQLELGFDSSGGLSSFGGDAFRVVDTSLSDGVMPDQQIVDDVITPLQADLASLNTVIGTTEVTLDATRSLVRTQETNFGNLIADAIRDAAVEQSVNVGADAPIIGLTNGGGIRNSVVIPAGDDITQLAIDTVLPFGNEVVIIEDVTPEQILLVLERAVSAVENVSGRFSQVSGFSFTYDPEGEAAQFTFDNDGNIVSVDNAGSRIVDVTLDGVNGGTTIIEDGEVVAGLENLLIDIATVNFLAGGGDGYPYEFLGLSDIGTGVTYDEALADFIATDLNGVVPDTLYPVGGTGRIVVVPEPATLSLLALGGLVTLRRRRG
jgi:5'-nucleotidase